MRYLFQYISYFFRSKYRKGFGVHSPFVFNLITNVIEERTPYYKYGLIEKVRFLLLKTNKTVFVNDFGTGRSGRKKISSIVKSSSKNKAYAQVLFRLINYYKAENILELGTSFGLTTMYLAAPNSKAKVVTIEACEEIAKYAELNFKRANFKNIQLKKGNIDDCLSQVLSDLKTVDFVFFDANHRNYSLLNYFEQCLSNIHAKTIFVIDDIYWSKEMTEAWNIIQKKEQVRVTIDMFFYGIVLFDPALQKENYTLFFLPQ